MSLAGLLAAVSSKPTTKIPPTNDPILAQIRPSGRSIAELTVKPSGGDFTTLADAAAAVGPIQAARMAAEGTQRVTPNYRVDIIVDPKPGGYVGNINVPQFSAWYGNGPRGSVYLQQDTAEPVPLLGVLATNGLTYWEGIDVIMLYQDVYIGGSPKYPVHGVNRRTSIYASCTLDASPKGPTATPFGSDGVDGGTTLFYDLDFLGGNTNVHGEAATRVPQTAMYVDCRSPAGVINWNALNNVAVDELWVVGGDLYGVRLEGNASRLHLDPDTVIGAGGVVKPVGSQDANTSWPVPVGGLSAADRAYYGL